MQNEKLFMVNEILYIMKFLCEKLDLCELRT